jgi:hypothetical protein
VDIVGAASLAEEIDLGKCIDTETTTKLIKVVTDRGISWDMALSIQSEDVSLCLGYYQWKSNESLVVLVLKKKGDCNTFLTVLPNIGFSQIFQPM